MKQILLLVSLFSIAAGPGFAQINEDLPPPPSRAKNTLSIGFGIPELIYMGYSRRLKKKVDLAVNAGFLVVQDQQAFSLGITQRNALSFSQEYNHIPKWFL